MNQHEGVQCDVCMKDRFEGGRYKCLRCHDYDLCADCFDANASSGNHLSSHPMQIVCSVRDMALYFGGEPIDGPSTLSLTCSYCGEPGFEPTALMTHLINLHSGQTDLATPVLCPICVRRPNGNVNYVTANLPGHFAIEHQIPAPRHFVSSFDASAVTALRNPPAAAAASRSTLRNNTNNSQGNRNPMDAFLLELMSHLPEVRTSAWPRAESLRESHSQARQDRRQARQQRDFNRLAAQRVFANELLSPEEQILLADGPPPTPPRTTSSRVSFGRSSGSRASTVQSLEAIMLGPSIQRLHAGFGRGQSLTRSSATLNLDFASPALQEHASRGGVFVESEHNPDWAAIAGAVGGANGPSSGSDSGRTLKPSRPPAAQQAFKSNNRFLLRKLFNPTIREKAKAIQDSECADRSLFVQALLLSAMSNDEEFGKQTDDILDDESKKEQKATTFLDATLKKKNKRRKKGVKTHSTSDVASQISSQCSQD